jgi:PHS family inorganic phosphate transporter-like MFS transporter
MKENDGILKALDGAHTQRYHLKTVIVAGMGFFSDAYDLFVISLVLPILAFVYFPETGIPSWELAAVAAAALFGAMVGQVLFGTLADRLGRKRIYAVTLTVMAIGAIGSALATPFYGLDVVVVIAIWRFILGVGVGGDYPISATMMSEFANVRGRGRQVATVFAMQGFGLLTGAVVTLGALALLPSTHAGLDLVWRLVLGLGAVPAIATIYFRTRVPETPRFILSVKGDAKTAAATVQSLTGAQVSSTSPQKNTKKVGMRRFLSRYGTLLFGTAACWFLVDVTFYSSSIFNPTVLARIGFASAVEHYPLNPTAQALAVYFSQVHSYLLMLAEGNIIIALFATVPGYWVAVATIDWLGRRWLQAVGFGVMSVSFFLLAIFYSPLIAGYLWLFMAIYATTFFFTNAGPNTTTFVIPSEVFPTKFRSTGHGISAASGKLGAAIATFFFAGFVLTYGLPPMLAILGSAALLGLIITLILTPEPAGRTLEDVSREDELEIVVERFSPHLESLASSLKEGSAELKALLAAPGGEEQAARIARIKAIEHGADEQVHNIYVQINNKRMKTQARSDIGALASSLDDILDGIEGVSDRVRSYHLTEARKDLYRFAQIVEACTLGVAEGINALDDLMDGRPERLQRSIVEVNRLENEADELLREYIEKLFLDNIAAVEIIKLKDLYERMEIITDRCEDVTDVFKDLIARYALLPNDE